MTYNFIVKVQKPLISSEDDPPWWVYSRNRAVSEYLLESQIPRKIVEVVTESTNKKGYFNCCRDTDGRLIFGTHPVPGQSW